jgi:hypothetical protein
MQLPIFLHHAIALPKDVRVVNRNRLRSNCHTTAARWCANIARWWRWSIQPRVVRHHPVEPNRHTLDNRQKNGARYRAVAHRLVPSSNRERATCKESGDDCVPWVLLLPYSLDRAVICVEETAPDAEVAAENRCAGFDCCESADASLAVWGVTELDGR